MLKLGSVCRINFFMKVLKAEQVAEILQASVRWVYAHAAELGASHIGRKWIFTEEGLHEALLESRRTTANIQSQRKEKYDPLGIDGKAMDEDRYGLRAALGERKGKTQLLDPNRHGLFDELPHKTRTRRRPK